MKKQSFLLFFLFYCITSLAQKNGANRIIVTLPEGSDVYKKVKLAFIAADFIVKDDENRDTISIYPMELFAMGGTVKIWAAIKDNTVKLFGVYFILKADSFGTDYQTTKEDRRITYYRGSDFWKRLKGIAERIGGQLSYAEE